MADMKPSRSWLYSSASLFALICLSACQSATPPTTTATPKPTPKARPTDSPTPAPIATWSLSLPTLKPKPTPLKTAKRFSEYERRDIFRKIVEAEDRGQKEADAQSPADPDSLMNKDKEAQGAILDANMKLADKLQKRYRDRVYKQFHLSKKEGDLIGNEGVTNRWPPLSP